MLNLGYVTHLHSHGFREVHHIIDENIDDRDWYLAVNPNTKQTKFIQMGPENKFYFISIPYSETKKQMELIKKFSDWKMKPYIDRVNLYSGQNNFFMDDDEEDGD